MDRSVVGVLAAAASVCFAPPATAQTIAPLAHPANVFTTVDAVKVEDGRMTVTGILQGESEPSTWSASFSYTQDAAAKAQFFSSCQTQALLAMSKPGQYLFEFQARAYEYGTPSCRLSRAAP